MNVLFFGLPDAPSHFSYLEIRLVQQFSPQLWPGATKTGPTHVFAWRTSPLTAQACYQVLGSAGVHF
jgi:hypothetical protein